MATSINFNSDSLVSGTSDNDTIRNYGDNVTIETGAGDDSVYSNGDNVLVKIDGGNNTINGAANVNMGKSNATLTGDRSAQIYQYVGGNDVITNYSHEDIIQITSGKIDSYSFDGGDLIFKIGKGSLRLKNTTNHAITVKDSSGETTTQIYSNGYSPQQVIKNFVKIAANSTLNNKLRLDEAIKACSGFNSLQEVIDKMVADCRAVGDAKTFLRDYCGIITDNDDLGAITGWDVGGLSKKTHDDLMPEFDAAIYPDSTTFTKRGLTITVPEKSTLTDKEQLVIQGLYSWWMENSLKLVEESYGLNFNDKPYSIPFKFEYKPDDFGWAWGGPLVSVNMSKTNFDESDRTGGRLDGALVHEFTHVMQCNFNVWSQMPNYMTEGMADLTAGSDSYTALAGNADSLAAYLDVNNTFSSDGNVYTVGYMFWRYLMKQASDSYDSSKGYAWKSKSSIVGTSDAELLTGFGKSVTISAGKGNDTITAYGKKMKVLGDSGNDYILASTLASGSKFDGGKGNDTIKNFSANVSINGGAGNDYIVNKANENYNFDLSKWETITSPDNVTILGGKGNDTIDNQGSNVLFKYASGDGKDVFTSYSTDTTINLTSGKINSSSLDGSDVILNIGDGFIKLQNASDKNITVKDAKGKVTSKIYSNKNLSIVGTENADTLTFSKGSNITISALGGNDSISNSANKTSISGGKGNDSIDNHGSSVTVDTGADSDFIINGGYFERERGGHNVKLSAGDGNDTITSNGSKSKLNGGTGDDFIYNGYRYYEPWDTFYNSDSDDYNGNNSTISGGKGNDTIKNCGNNVLFKYAKGDGNDSIQGFNATSTLQIDSSYSKETSGLDIIVTVGDAKITLAGAANLSTVNISEMPTTLLTANDKTKSPVTASSSIKVINASTRTKAIKITGNALDNSISGGSKNDTISGGKGNDSIVGNAGKDKLYGNAGKDTLKGGKGNDSLWGGAGNDKLYGGAGNDTFIYKPSEGTDKIYDYAEGDMLKILKTNGKEGGSFTKSEFSSGDLTLAIKGGGTVVFDGVAKGDKFNINGKSYTIKGSTLK